MDERKDTESMTLDRFTRIVEAYGSRADRWPEQEREAALQLVAGNEQARALLERSAGLDELIDAAPDLSASRSLRERILAAAPAARRRWAERLNDWASGLWPLGRNWQPLGALAAAAALGVAAGLGVPAPADAEPEAYEVSDLVLEEYDETGEVP